MEGTTSAWYEMIDLKLRDYRDFEHEFRTEFEGFDYKERLTRSILCMKQDKNTSPTVFIANMYKRIKYCEGFKSEDEAVRMIRTALNPFWKKQLLIYNCKSVLDIFRACQEIMQLNRSDLEVNDNKLFNFVPDCDITNEHKNDIDSRLVPLDPMLYREKGAKIFADKRKSDKDSNSHKFVRTFDKIKTLRSFPNKFNKGKFDNNKKKVWVNKQQGSVDTTKQTSHFENKQTYSKPSTHSHQDSTQNKGNGGSWKPNNFDKNKTAAKPSFPLDGKPSWRANCVFCEGPHDVRECHELLELQDAVNEAGPEGSEDEEEAINDLENDKNVIGLIDCGANCNVIDIDIYKRLNNTVGLEKASETLLVVGGKNIAMYKTKLFVKFPSQAYPVQFDFYVMHNIPFVILGTYLLKKLAIDISITKGCYIQNKMSTAFLNSGIVGKNPNRIACRVTVAESKINDINNFAKLIDDCRDVCDIEHLGKLREVLTKNRQIFSELPAIAKGVEFSIDFYEGQSPKKLNAYPANPMKRKMIDDCIDELIDNNLIEESDSPCSSPCIVVPKPNTDQGRFVVDYRALNTITKVDSFPLPRIDEIITNLGKAKFFTVIDLTKGYHQIPIKQSDRWKTAFVTYRGLYQYLAMPFGAKNAPACFQRAMNSVLGHS